jgi:hypothetical protein
MFFPYSTISNSEKAALGKAVRLLSNPEYAQSRRKKLKSIEEVVRRRTPPARPAEKKQLSFAQMLTGIIEWKLDRLRRELTTPGAIPWPKHLEADVWLSSNCPTLYGFGKRLEDAGLIEQTENGFNMKCKKALFANLLRDCGFRSWKAAGKYFTINGQKVNGDSLKNQAQGKWPKDWYKITAILPELALKNRLPNSK